MSDDSIPAPEDQHKPEPLLIKIPTGERPPFTAEQYLADLITISRLGWPETTAPKLLVQPRQRQRRTADPETYSPIEHTLHSLQTFGFTHPNSGRYLMVPKEFQAILVRETKAVATVVWEVMQQTIGWEEAPGKRREWAPLTKRHFVRTGMLSRSQAEAGIKRAIEKGYIRRRQIGARRFEYAIRWKGTN
jgi:hypothetical protein